MKTIILSLQLLLIGSLSIAQTKMLTMEDALVKNKTTLAPETLKQLQFVYGTDDYVYVKKINDKEVWMRGNISTKEDQQFLTLDQLNQKLANANRETFGTMPVINFSKSPEWIISSKWGKVQYSPLNNKFKTIIDKDAYQKENVEEGSGGYTAYLDNHNLFVTDGKNPRQVTTDGSTDIVYASSVHRDEFGITKGTFWSNDGKSLAFYRMDQSMVTDYPIIDWTTRPAKVVNTKYPMAGDKSHHVTVGVYNTEKGSVVYLETGKPEEQYLTNVAWAPGDNNIFIAVLNRGQNHMKLNQYNATTGKFVKTVFEEKDDKYVEPLVPVLFVKNKPHQFIWQSFRDGWNHLYLYNTDGDMLRQLTKGEWNVLEVKGFDSTGEKLFYTSTEESPLTKNLYELELKNGRTKRLTQGAAVHVSQVSTSGNYVLDNFNSASIPKQIQLLETASGKTKTLLTASNPLADYKVGQMSVFTIKGNSGVPLYCRLFKPVGFDSTKKYPVIVYWYGGPHNQMITAGFNGGAGDYWFQYMAERGYVVFTIDVRGSANRGRAFEQAIFRKAGEAQMEDMMSGVNYLQSMPWVDKSSMGLFGWSYGGFMTIDFILHHPGVFKSAVAGGPVTDWSYYEVMYGERYMDTPQENPDGYAATNLVSQVDKLKGKLLIIHGLQDPVVVQQNSVRFVRAAIDKGVQVDYMIYPGHEHNVLGKDRAHLYQKVTDFLNETLK